MEKNFEFYKPKLRNESLTEKNHDGSTTVFYRDQSCDLITKKNYSNDIHDLISLLKVGGLIIKDYEIKLPRLKGEIIPIIMELDQHGLITETEFPILDKSITGRKFNQEISYFFDKIKTTHAESEFYNLLISEKATKSQLIGYVTEYYHLVKLAPGLIAPSLAKLEGRKTRKILQDFLRSELYHDKMLEESLNSIQIPLETIDLIQPLQSTFSICASLGVYAQQHPLTFKSILFMFEKPYPEFNEAFKNQCKLLEMPRGFYDPILKHSDINEEGDHDSITKMLLEEIKAISYEEQLAVKKHLCVLVESFIKQEKEIIKYYGSMMNFKPRIFI